jgi:hypothetical protein
MLVAKCSGCLQVVGSASGLGVDAHLVGSLFSSADQREGEILSKYVGAAIAVSVIAAQPAVANDLRSAAASDYRPAAFGGVTVRLPFGQKAAAKPDARLQLTTYRMDPSQPAAVRKFSSKGLEFGMSKAGKPLLFAGGQNTAKVKQKLGLNTTTTALIVGGVILLVAVVVVAASRASLFPDCEPYEGNDDHCTD